MASDDGTLGVYVHVPFCERVCPYCDFAVVGLGRAGLEPARERAYVDALLRELDLRAPDFGDRVLETIYFGGGTPSLLQPESLARIAEALRSRFAMGEGACAESTLEVNPSTLEIERLAGFRAAASIDRLSIGAQSFDDATLKALGRAHRAEAIHRCLERARSAGFDNLSVDLIFAAPQQTADALAADLDAVLDHRPEHVSTYELVIEAGTPFARAAARGQLVPCAEDDCAQLMEQLHDGLEAAGYRRYELTNHARPGFESRHNRRYWQRRPVLGLGVGAHSIDPPKPTHPYGRRPANPRSLATYLQRVASAGRIADHVEVPTREEAVAEAVFLGLRLAEGLSAARFEADFGVSPRGLQADAIDALVADGLLVESPESGDLRLTRRGAQIADTVCARFL